MLATWQTITLISRKILAINNYSSQSTGSCLHRWKNITSGQMDSEGYSLHFEHFQCWKSLLVSWLTGIHNQIFRFAVPCKQMLSKICFSESWALELNACNFWMFHFPSILCLSNSSSYIILCSTRFKEYS